MAIVRNTIILKSYSSNVFEEHLAGGTIYPGMLLLMSAADTVIAHNDDAPTNCAPLFAVEDALQGKDINDTYSTNDPVKCWIPKRGDWVLAILADGEDVSAGDFLESNGTGYLQKATSGATVGQAMEDLDLSGSSGEEASSVPLGFNKRIKVRIN